MPEIPTRTGRTAANDAHYVRAGAERHEVTFDVYYLAECGARCFPFYRTRGPPREDERPATHSEGDNVATAIMMLDHPAWLTGEDGRARRAFRSAGAVWSMVCTPRSADGRHDVEIVRAAGETNVPPVVDVIDSRGLRGDGTACAALRADGPVGRVRNPDIWEALGTSIIRQVIRAAQARKLYRAFCEIHGERVDTAAGPVFLFPTPETVLALSDDEFAGLGMKFFRVALRNAADAFFKAGDEWATLSPAELVRAVQAPRRIGPWTAGATVRTWAGHLAPSVSWPPSPTSPTTTASIRSPTSPPRPNTSSAGPGARWPARSCPSGRCRWVGFNLLAPTYEISARIAERLDRAHARRS
jgi:DNA-3-methyladenine glycosylase II